MQTKDFIQLLEITPNIPVSVEYLPGLFVNKGFEVVAIQNVPNDNVQEDTSINHNGLETQLHINEPNDENTNPVCSKDLLSLFRAAVDDDSEYQDTSLKVKFGNEEFQTAILDVTEVEYFEKTLTMKLFFTNRVPNDWKKSKEPVKKAQKKGPKKRMFSKLWKKTVFPSTLPEKWSPQWLLSFISK